MSALYFLLYLKEGSLPWTGCSHLEQLEEQFTYMKTQKLVFHEKLRNIE
jgi:hypothetical protein